MKNRPHSIVSHLSLLYKLAAMIVTVTLIVLSFPHTNHGTHYDYREGSLWRHTDLVAPFDFTVPKTADQLQIEQDIERQKALLYYRTDSSAYSQTLMRLEAMRATMSHKQHRAMRHAIDSIYRRGYLLPPNNTTNLDNRTIVLLNGNMGSEHNAHDFILPDDIDDSTLRNSLLIPNIIPDPNRTAMEIESRLSQIAYSSRTVMAGDPIIGKGETVDGEKARTIAALEAENDRRHSSHFSLVGQIIGQILLAIIAFIALYLFLKNTGNNLLDDNRKLTFILVLILTMSALEALMIRTRPEWVLLVPLCIIPILMRVFFGTRVALYVHLTTVITLANLVPNSFEFIFYQLITGMMSIITIKKLEQRQQFFYLSGVIFISYSMIYTCGVLSQETTLAALSAERFLIFALNAFLTLLSYPLIFLSERLTGMTTNLTMLELSSTNNPALRELSRRAPGTFQHSMQVANIAEDIINEIGGNALLTKVGALYHDIGKMAEPLYFTENQNSGLNPHQDLDYAESSQIIISHVVNGLEFAHRYHIPAEVQDFIRTHHGTTFTGYFYAKELEHHPDHDFKESLFQYPGPKPYSRETATVMLVDSVEAACRSLKNHTKESTDRLIDQLIDSKIDGGQLDNSQLTLNDIAKIRQLLKQKMLSIYHVRIEYPTLDKK
ncbi:MAG: HDIG domain-containing protein [Bacteroidales bacterium]|nr:HDIG domain-containing protein [Bacteroidales bacterium]